MSKLEKPFKIVYKIKIEIAGVTKGDGHRTFTPQMESDKLTYMFEEQLRKGDIDKFTIEVEIVPDDQVREENN